MGWITYSLLSAFFAGLVGIFGKVGIRNIDSTVATAVRATIMAGSLIMLILFNGTFSQIRSIDRHSLVFIFLSGLSGAASWLAFFAALKLAPASKVAPLDKLSVVVTLVIAVLFLREKVSTQLLLGSILILIGSIFVVRS
ncbi:MAG: EamA family transporter [Clostridia bacterium]|nr:EamA family transporter [Clostridia bacterium]